MISRIHIIGLAQMNPNNTQRLEWRDVETWVQHDFIPPWLELATSRSEETLFWRDTMPEAERCYALLRVNTPSEAGGTHCWNFQQRFLIVDSNTCR